jgi:ribonuclease HII
MRDEASLRVERRLLRAGSTLVCGVDEVGRGALSGPVSVGMVLVDASVRRSLPGVRDSKLLTPAARRELVPRIHRWCLGHAVGHASAQEIDEHGIIGALRLAGHRALAELPARPDLVLLDGSHDWFSHPGQGSLFDDPSDSGPPLPPVVTMVKADVHCASVAAASVLAKTTRDDIMVRLSAAHPGYEWDVNKGYAAPVHLDALRTLGPSPEHRVSWHLPGVAPVRDETADGPVVPS